MPTKVYTYGAKLPIHGLELLDDSIIHGHRYYNALIALNRARAEKIDALRHQLIPGLDDAEAAVVAAESGLEDLRAAVRQRNAERRTKTATPEDRQAIKAAVASLKEAKAIRKEIRSRCRDCVEYKESLDKVWNDFSEASKAAYNESPCWWGTKLHISQSVERAVESSAKIGGVPRFRRWEQVRFDPAAGDDGAFVGAGDGVAAVQLQGGMTVEELLAGADWRLRMEFVADGKRTSLRAARKVIFSLRLGSDGREPRWVRIPAYYHRGGELPVDAKIMWAMIVRRALAPRRQRDGSWRPWYEYSVQLTVRTGEARPTADGGICGVNLGWRTKPDGSLRVAVAVGGNQETHECVLPAHMLAGWKLGETLQGHRSVNFDRIRAVLADWLRGSTEPPLGLEVSAVELDRLATLANVAEDADRFRRGARTLRAWAANWTRPADLPAWLTTESQYVGLWKSHARLAQLLDRWRSQRFNGDEAAFSALMVWREREAHLQQWETALRKRLDGQRKDIYRKFAARLARRYQVVATEDTDYRALKLRKPAEDNADDAAVKEHMRHGAPGLMRQYLRGRAAVELRIKSKDISRIHIDCGGINSEDRRPSILIVCPHCKVEYDQDVNAARNVLARAEVVNETPGAAREAQPKETGDDTLNDGGKRGRWSKRKADRSRKQVESAAQQ